MPNQYSNPLIGPVATARQKRQRKLSWALKICMGFETAATVFIPKDVGNKHKLLADLKTVIDNIRYELRNIP